MHSGVSVAFASCVEVTANVVPAAKKEVVGREITSVNSYGWTTTSHRPWRHIGLIDPL